MGAILITEDSDFGEWVFAHKVRDVAVIFLRYPDQDAEIMAESVVNILKNGSIKFENIFITITLNKVRIRHL